MKVLSKILLSIFALFALSSIGGYFYFRKKFQAPANQLVVTQLPATTAFAWRADTANHRAMPHAALLVQAAASYYLGVRLMGLFLGVMVLTYLVNAVAVGYNQLQLRQGNLDVYRIRL